MFSSGENNLGFDKKRLKLQTDQAFKVVEYNKILVIYSK